MLRLPPSLVKCLRPGGRHMGRTFRLTCWGCLWHGRVCDGVQDFALVGQFGVAADRVSCFDVFRRRFGVKPSHSMTETSPTANECPVLTYLAASRALTADNNRL